MTTQILLEFDVMDKHSPLDIISSLEKWMQETLKEKEVEAYQMHLVETNANGSIIFSQTLQYSEQPELEPVKEKETA